MGVSRLGLGVWGLVGGVWGLRSRVKGLGFRVRLSVLGGLHCVWCVGCGVQGSGRDLVSSGAFI